MDSLPLRNGLMDACLQSSSPIMHRFVSKVRTDPILLPRRALFIAAALGEDVAWDGASESLWARE